MRHPIMKAIQQRDLQELARTALAQGWTIARTGAGHLRWHSPAGAVVFTASTPGQGRALENTRALLKRKGLVL